MENQAQENSGYSFESNEQFSWNNHQLNDERLMRIQEGISSLRSLCSESSSNDEPEDKMLLETMCRVLETLEHTFVHHFESKSGHIVSPKSVEPWD